MKRALGLAVIGIALAACSTSPSSPTSPHYTYAYVASGQCVNNVVPDAGASDCVMLMTLPTKGPESACATLPGLSTPDDSTLAAFEQWTRDAAGGDAGASLSYPVCVLAMLDDDPTVTCQASNSVGWCYVQSATSCNAIILSAETSRQIKGATFTLRCK